MKINIPLVIQGLLASFFCFRLRRWSGACLLMILAIIFTRAVVETDSSETKTETAKFFREQNRDQNQSRSQSWLQDRDRQSSRPRPRPKK